MRVTVHYDATSTLFTQHTTDGPDAEVERQLSRHVGQDGFANLADVTAAPQILLALWSPLAVAGVLIALKLLARSRKRLRWWWDDYIMLLSWVRSSPSCSLQVVLIAFQLCLGTGSICLTMSTKHGLGRHIEFLDNDARANVLRFGSIAAALTVAASVWSKVSYALFLLRISSSGCTEWTRNAILGVIISLNMMLPVMMAAFFMSCRPVEKNWRLEMDGTCWDPSVKIYMAMAVAGRYASEFIGGSLPSTRPRVSGPSKFLAYSVLTRTVYSGVMDLVLALLPWKIIWCLPVQRRDKIGLVVVMSLGVLYVCIRS